MHRHRRVFHPRGRCRIGGQPGTYWVRTGQALVEALDSVLDDVAGLGGDGGIIAVTAAGETAMRYNSEGMKRASIGNDAPLEVATFG